MKVNLIVFPVIALLVLSFGNAFADEPPGFGEGIKLGEVWRDTWQSGMHGLIVDGSNVYAVRVGGLDSEKEVMLDKSNDGGMTWLHSTIARGPDILVAAMAINPVTKELHYAWNTYEPNRTRNLYYGNGTITKRVNGSLKLNSSKCSNIAVDGNGVIHIIFAADNGKLYHTSSTDNGVTFSAPAAIASGNWIALALDSAGSLYLVYKGNDGNYYFMKKTAGGTWITPSPDPACANCPGNDPSIAVYDSERIYFAVRGKVAASSDGGKTWTPYTIPGQGHGESSLAISSNGILNYAWYVVDGNVHFARTTKSHDPSSWGQPVIALAGASPNVAVDSAGKAYIVAAKSKDAIFKREK